MGKWIRVDVGRQQHARSMIAGGWGGVVVEAVWEIVKSRGDDGILAAMFWTPEYIAEWTRFSHERGGIPGIKRGMKKAVEAGLLEELDDGSVQVHDWTQYQIDRRTGNRKPDPYKNARLQPPDPVVNGERQGFTVDNCECAPTGHDSTRQDRTRQEEGTRAPDYSITHPPVAPDPVEPKPNLSWVVQEAFRNQYEEKYGHRSRWNEPGHGQKAADLVEYFRDLAEHKGVDLDADMLARGVKNATKRYVRDTDEFVVKAAHSFDLFVSRIDRYVGRQK